MNREQLEAMGLEFKRLAMARMPKDDAVFVCVMGTREAGGLIVATSVPQESLQELFGLLAGLEPRKVDFDPDAGGEG